MKRLFVAFLLALPLLCNAEDIAINFSSVPLAQFVQSTYKAMLKRDYVIAPELLAMEKPISISVRSVQSNELPQLIDRVLIAQGVKSELRDGIYFLSLSGGSGSTGAGSFGGAPVVLSGAVPVAPGRVATLDGASLAGAVPGDVGLATGRAVDDSDAERDVYRPRNRKPDYLATVLNASFANKLVVAVADYVVLTGSKKQIAKMLRLAEQVDEPLQRVRISATFVEVSSNESAGLGVSVVANVLGAHLGIKLGDASSGAFTLKTSNFQAVIDALASDGRFKQVAAPTAIVDSYERGNLSFGDSVPTIGSSILDRNGTSIQQVQYQQSGVLLNVTPIVLGSGRISVNIDGQISSFSATTTGVSASPTLSKRQVQTSVTVDDGELLMIGGLNSNKSTNNSNGFSFLPKSWAVHSGANANTDLVLILSASVMR
ncbi:type II secretion system protein GspD [Pseudoduganella sp. S-14]|uniref:type II secretion system protein GspD n=1 Tax=Pseudoduganella sp. S-14 TaxID=3404065 RepID=UPI003CF18469